MKKIAGTALLVLGVFAASQAVASDWHNYRVTITNATSHHVITPPLIIVHNRNFKLFNVTSAASEGLATQAETGNNSVLYNEVYGEKGVYNVVAASGPVVYGNTASYELRAPKKAKITVTGMLATSNDAFAAISGKALPRKSVTYMATTYDAGSEANNESCAYIPGPPCSPESGNARAIEGAEGFITIHAGIRGGSDLNPAHLDWRGATAIVTIERIDNE